MNGVEIHANILHSLLSRKQIQPIAWKASLLLQCALCLGLSALFAVMRPTYALLVSLGAAALAAFALTQSSGFSWWVLD